MVNQLSIRELINEDLNEKETVLVGGKQVRNVTRKCIRTCANVFHLQVVKQDGTKGTKDRVHAMRTVLADIFLPAGYPSSVSSGSIHRIFV